MHARKHRLRARERELVWTTEEPSRAQLARDGYHVVRFSDFLASVLASRATGLVRASLRNPAARLLALFSRHARVAIIGVRCQDVDDLKVIFGYLVEPAYRNDCSLLLHVDRELEDLDQAAFVDLDWRYPWTLERLRFVAQDARRRAVGGDPQSMTPVEALLHRALCARGLAPRVRCDVGPYRAGIAFPRERLVVECDGRGWHDVARDRCRDAHLRQQRWEVIRFSSREVARDAGRCALSVALALASRPRLPLQPEAAPPLTNVNPWRRIASWLSRCVDGRRAGQAGWAFPPAASVPPLRPLRLDPEQTAAVRASDGVVQVIAPAGSGKTSVLIERVKELLSRGAAASRILCTTFNKEARTEIERRLNREGVAGVKVHSFHGLGWSILKQEGRLRSTVGRLGHAQWRWLATQAMHTEPDGVWIDAPDAQNDISAFKLAKMIPSETALELAKSSDAYTRTAARLFSLHEQLLRERRMLDFDDLIATAVALLQSDASIRRRWQARFEHVLVDEYQDIEPAQALLVGMLAAPEDSLFCVGDEDQCIYAWRRATVQRVVELDQCYPGLKRFPLVRNYRCGKKITAASRRLIEHNRRRFHKPIKPGAAHKGEISLTPAADRASGAARVADRLRGASRRDVVVLARTTTLLREVALACASREVHFDAPEKVVQLSDVQQVLQSYTRLLADPRHARAEDIDRVFRAPNRSLPSGAAEEVALSLHAGATFSQALAALPTEAWRQKKLSEAGALLDALGAERDAGRLVQRLRDEGGLDAHYESRERMNETEQVDLEALESALSSATGRTVLHYSGMLGADTAVLRAHVRDDAVGLSTIHAAKGREWDCVILYGADRGQLPHRHSISGTVGEHGMEDERRLFYVALTRATARLEIVYTANSPSPFLAEAGLPVR